MGQVFLKIRKPTDLKDGHATDEIATADVSGSYIVDITGTDSNNARIALCNEVKLYDGPGSGGADRTTAWGAEVVGIVVVENDADAFGKLEEARVLKRGSGISGSPEARFLLKGKTNYDGDAGTDYAAVPLTLGTGTPETELVLISEDGQDAPNVDGLFLKLDNDAKFSDKDNLAPDFTEFFNKGPFENVQEIKLFDPYKKKIDYKDIKDFATGPLITSIGAYQALSSIKQLKSQTAQANKAAEAAAEHARQINITLKAKYESDKLVAEQVAVDNYYTALESYQSNWGISLTQYSVGHDPGAAIVDPVWNAAVQAVDNWFDLIEMWGGQRPTITNFSPNEPWIKNLENATGQVFPSLGEAQVSNPKYLSESWSPVNVPSYLDTVQKIAKGYLIKTICFAAIATLGGIFSRLSGSGTAWSKGSSVKVTYAARVWRENTEDGLWASWFRSSMRSHDLFAHLLTMFASIGSVVKSLGNKNEYPGVSEDNFKRLEALTREAAAAGYIESLKHLYELLGKWVNLYKVKESSFKKTQFGFKDKEDFAKFTQKLEIIRGRIAVHLDGIAYSWQHSASLYSQSGSAKNQQPQINLYRSAGAWKTGSSKKLERVVITNQGVIPTGGLLSLAFSGVGGVMGTAVLGKVGGLIAGIALPPYELPTYGLETVTNLPSVDILLANSISSATIVNGGGDDDFHWPGRSPGPSAVVRVPPNWWFNPTQKAKEIMALDSTVAAGTASLSEADPGGGSEEINDPNISGGALYNKWHDIYDRLQSFSADISTEVGDESAIFLKVITDLGLSSSSDKGLTGDADTFSSLIDMALYTPKIGDCSNSEIQKIDDTLAKTFFADIGAYAIKIAPQKAKENICNKQSCGAAHVYTKPPMVDELPHAPMCGNVTVKYNLHPTSEWRLTNAEAGSFFAQLLETDASVNITRSLRIKDAEVKPDGTVTGNRSWSAGRAAAQDGDMTLPAVFGNYTFAFDNAEEGFSLSGLFSFIVAKLTFGAVQTKLKDPRITIPISAYHQALLRDYNAERLFKGENYICNSTTAYALVFDSKPTLAPIKTNLKPDTAWSPQDSANFRKQHINNLNAGYQAVADAGGYHQLKKALAAGDQDARDITPLLSAQQTFSGICFPVVKQWDLAKKPFRFIIDDVSLGAWGPTSNDLQRYEEFSYGRKEGLPGAPHLPKLGTLGNPNDDGGRTAGTNAKYKANHDVFISETPYFKGIYESVKRKINDVSSYITRFEIEDINIFTEVAEKGLLAGNGNPLSQAIVDNNTTEFLQDTYCIDVEGYWGEAEKARQSDTGGWTHPNGNTEAWDSKNLKAKYKVPHDYYGYAQGNNYISGSSTVSTGEAFADAEARYENFYKKYVNVFHLTGHPLFKVGVRGVQEATYEKTAYANTTANAATAAAENLLIEETEWSDRVGQTDSDGNPLARSGVKDGFPSRVTATWFGGAWSPIEPAVVGSQTKHITGKGHDATAANTHFTSLRASACAEGEIDGVVSNTVTFSGSITGVGSTSGAALTNAMNALNTYSNSRYNIWGTGLNVARTSPVNTVGVDAHNFLKTGATTYSGGVSSGITPLALFDPYDSAAINLGWTSRILYKSALLNVPAADICESDTTSSNCPEISASSSIHTLHDDCDSTDCEIRILENGGLGVSTNWVAAVSGVRKSMYEAIRQRLVEQEYNDENAEGVDCHDLSTGTYSFSDIGTSIAVFPNINALCSIEESNNEIAWSDGCDVLNPSAWSSNGLRTASQADAAISHSDVGGSNIYQIINLKDWTAGTGDKDIYVMEEVNMVNNTIYDAETQCEGGAAGRSGDAERDLVRYGYRTAIFTPQSMSNLSGAIFGSGGGGGTITSTTALIAPTVVTGSGYCNVYDDHVWKSVVTGDYADTEAKAFIPLLRNEYSVKACISGSVPTVTGVCDWSSSSRQTWYDANNPSVGPGEIIEESSNWGTSLYKPSVKEERVDQGEKYYIKYGDGIEGLQSTWVKAGAKRLTSSQKQSANKYAPNNENPTTSPQGENSLSTSVVPFGRQNPLDLSNITEAITQDVRDAKGNKSVYMLGGWPIKNQASSEADIQKTIKEKQVFGSFSDQYVIVRAGGRNRFIKSHGPKNHGSPDWSPNKILKNVVKSVIPNKQTALLEPKEAVDFVDNVRQTQSNIEDIETGALNISWNDTNKTWTLKFEGKTYSVRGNKINTFGKRIIVPPVFKDNKGVDFFYYKISYNATACQACVSTPAEDIVDKEVLVYHENYLQYAQVDWHMRSGDFQFEVPYIEPGSKVVVDGTEIIAKHWSEYITADFVKNSDTYTGEWTAYGQAFPSTATQLGCPEEHDQPSKLNKIVDYQIGFGKEYSYRKMRGVTNKINFDYKKNKSNTNKN